MKTYLFILILSSAVTLHNDQHEKFTEAYFDKTYNVQIVDIAGKRIHIKSDRSSKDLKLSPDHRTVAWVTSENGTEQLHIYRERKSGLIRCAQLIRSYWFVKQGDQIAIDCGGTHFAGQESLYDTATRKKIDSFDQAITPLGERHNGRRRVIKLILWRGQREI